MSEGPPHAVFSTDRRERRNLLTGSKPDFETSSAAADTNDDLK